MVCLVTHLAIALGIKAPNVLSNEWAQAPTHGRSYARFGAFLAGGSVAAFDASAFRLARPEAAPLDPHARLLLEQTAVRLGE